MAASITTSRGMGQPKKKKMKDMTVDEFLGAAMDSDSESSSKSNESFHLKVNGSVDDQFRSTPSGGKDKSSKLKLSKSVTFPEKKNQAVKGLGNEPMNLVSDKSLKKGKAKKKTLKTSKSGKTSLARTLQENDPEFYEYLKGEDQSLLNNLEDLSDEDEDETVSINDLKRGIGKKESAHTKDMKQFEKELFEMSSDENSEDDDSTTEGYIHKVPDKLEVASDDSGTESENDLSGEEDRNAEKAVVVTNKLLGQWAKQIQLSPSPKLFKEIVSAFHGAVYEAGGNSDSDQSYVLKYRIKDSSIFNGIVRLCLLHVAPVLQSMLQISASSNLESLLSKSKKWKKIKADVKSYTSALLQLLTQLSEAVMVNAILKHIHKLVQFYIVFPKLSRTLMKQMIKIWTTGEETSRVLAFLCINKLIQLKRDPFLEISVKKLYMAYVSNCKFVSPTTLPLINFMQRSLVEVLSNDFIMAYQYAFVYVRQLAIHLRNAISVKKKDLSQIVYNWQYIHCLSLWVQLLSSHPTDTLKPLIYPLTQTIVGTIKLMPTARFYPLRFHCVRLLNLLSSKTNTYIPTLPFLLDVFEQTDFNKRHKNVSLKPFNFAVLLKFSKSQLVEKAFKDGLIDQLYELLLESYNVHAHSVGFPELIIPSFLQLKDFIKKCKIANYCKQMKQIVDKIDEQSKFVVERRKQSMLRLDDFEGVQKWEQKIDSSPLRKFYTSWRKLRDRELQHEIAHKEQISGAAIDVPSVPYKKKMNTATPEERESLAKLFEDESDSDNETRFLLKEERPEQLKKKRKRSDAGDETDSEDYSDFDDEELEQLARSASEDESEEDSEDDVVDECEGEEMARTVQSRQVKSGHNVGHNDKVPKAKMKTEKNQRTQQGVDGEEDDAEDVVEDFVLSDSDSE